VFAFFIYFGYSELDCVAYICVRVMGFDRMYLVV